MAEYSKNLGDTGKKLVNNFDGNSIQSNVLNIESTSLTPLDEPQ